MAGSNRSSAERYRCLMPKGSLAEIEWHSREVRPDRQNDELHSASQEDASAGRDRA